MRSRWMESSFKDKYVTKARGSISRTFNIGKFKGKPVDWVCHCFPDYIEWCLKNWDGFKLLKEERLSYMSTLRQRLDRDPNNEELKIRLMRAELFYTTGKINL